jgi:hypothetical protein
MTYWAYGPFVRSFTLLVDPGDICPPQGVPCDSESVAELRALVNWTDDH